jgi:hypothetical protein
LPVLWDRLHLHLPPAQRGLHEFVSYTGARGSHMPVNTAVLDTLHSLPLAMMEWANVCRSSHGQRDLPTVGKRWQFILTEAVSTLVALDEELHYSVWSVDYLNAVFDAQTRMISLAGLARLVHRLNAACPECGRRHLIRHNGADRVHCYHCGRSWSAPEYRQLTIVQAHHESRRVAT